MMAVRPQRVARFGRTMQPPQTRLVAFRTPGRTVASGPGNGPCACRGCTQDWTTSRRGSWVLQRPTAQQRWRRAMQAGWQGGRTQRHDPRREQDRRLSHTRQGPDQDDGIRGNDRQLAGLDPMADTAWRSWLRRRSQPSAIRGAKCGTRLQVSPLPQPRSLPGLSPGRPGSPVRRSRRAAALATEAPDA